MHIKMFHRVRGRLEKFFNRVVGVARYIFDYKILLFSILYIVLNPCVIFLLRNILQRSSIGFFELLLSLLIPVSLLILSRKFLWKFIEPTKMGQKYRVGVFTFFVLAKYASLAVLISVVWSWPVLFNESSVLKDAESFTNSSTSFNMYISEEVEEKHRKILLTATLLEDLNFGGKMLPKNSSKVLIKLPNFYDFSIGQVCKVSGQLSVPENFDDFDYQKYLGNKKIFFLMDAPQIECQKLTEVRKGNFVRNILVDFKMKMVGYVDQVLNEPQSSLLVGILFGQKRLFSNSFEEATRISGVSHIISASGYNVTILIIAINKVFFFLPKKSKVIAGLIVIWLYCILSGLSTSIVRATIMGSVSMIALLFGRSSSVHISIPLVSFLFLLLNPMAISDVGFLLSLSALLGLVYLLPIFVQMREKVFKKAAFLDEYILPTLSCTLTTLPVSILTFKTFTIWSVLVNALILPIVESTMLFGFLAIIFFLLFKPFSYILFSVINVQLKCFEVVVMFVKDIGVGQFDIERRFLPVLVSILLLFFVVLVIYFFPLENEKYNYYLKNS